MTVITTVPQLLTTDLDTVIRVCRDSLYDIISSICYVCIMIASTDFDLADIFFIYVFIKIIKKAFNIGTV